MVKREKRKRWVLGVLLTASVMANVISLVAYSYLYIQTVFAAEQVDTFLTLAAEDRTGVAQYIKGYYPPGTKLPKDSALSSMVERVREYVLQNLCEVPEKIIVDRETSDEP